MRRGAVAARLAALIPLVVGSSVLRPGAAQADSGVSYSPSPGYPGSTEEFWACGFWPGEMVAFQMDGGGIGQSQADGLGCAWLNYQTPADMTPTTHDMAAIGEGSAAQQLGAYLVMAPTATQLDASGLADGSWTLNVTSTVTRDSGGVTANGAGSASATFTASRGTLRGQGQLAFSLDMKAADSNCHGGLTGVPFTVGGTTDGAVFHLVMTGSGAPAPVTVMCDNGASLPFQLPGGSETATYDIAAIDGKTVDVNAGSAGSLPFITTPAGFSGHSHLVLTRSQ